MPARKISGSGIRVTRRKGMNARFVLGSLVAVAALAILPACGGGGSDHDTDSTHESGIQTQKGLAVAALAQNLGLTGTNGSVGGRGAAPAADTSAGSSQSSANAYSNIVG